MQYIIINWLNGTKLNNRFIMCLMGKIK